jgi:hypothetical protein
LPCRLCEQSGHWQQAISKIRANKPRGFCNCAAELPRSNALL